MFILINLIDRTHRGTDLISVYKPVFVSEQHSACTLHSYDDVRLWLLHTGSSRRVWTATDILVFSCLCTVISFWCEMSSSILRLLCLQSISSNLKFSVNNNYSTTVVVSPFQNVLLKSVQRLVERNNRWVPVRTVCPLRSAAGAWCFQPVSLSETFVYLKSFIQTCAGKLRARCGLQLNSHRDSLKCKMSGTTKYFSEIYRLQSSMLFYYVLPHSETNWVRSNELKFN